jgi:16S rRNA G966 N2-methylase RsmD
MWKGFELVFADPPYEGELGTLTLMAISKNAKPSKRCLIIMEHAPDNPPGHVPGKFHQVDSRKYGNTGVTFFEFQNDTGRSA